MPNNPQVGDLHVDQLLTNVSIGYRNGLYIVDDICPMIPVNKQSNIVPKYDQSHWFRDDAVLRLPGTKSEGGGFSIDVTDTYFCQRYSYRFEIADDQRDNQDAPFDLDRDGALFVADKIALRRERNFASSFFTTGIWGTDTTPAAPWSNYGGSAPLVEIASWQDTVEGLIAKEPMDLIIGKQVWVQLKWHPDLIDSIKYTTTGKMSVDTFATLADLTNVRIGRALVTTSALGTAEASVTYTRVWGKSGLLLYVPPSPSLMNPAACYNFVWQRVPSALQYIRRMRDEEREVDIIEGNSYFAQKVTASKAGLFVSSLVA